MMMGMKEVIHVALQIEKLHAGRRYEDVEALLRQIEELPFTVGHLQHSGIVAVLYRVLKTCPVVAVVKHAKRLLSKWKRLYKESNEHRPTSTETEGKYGSKRGWSVGCVDSSDSGLPDNNKSSIEMPEGENGSRNHLSVTQSESSISALPDSNNKPFTSELPGETGSSSCLSVRGDDPSTLIASPEEEVCSPNEKVCKESNICEHHIPKLMDESSQTSTGIMVIKGSSVARLGVDNREHNKLTSPEQLSQEPSSTPKVTTVTPAWHSKDASSLRSRCTQLIFQALSQPGASDPVTVESVATLRELANAIEEHVFTLHSGNECKYKCCLRSKVSNLRNPKSPHLRQGLVSGELRAEQFAQMSAIEMASEELQQLRAEYTKMGISQHQLPQMVEGTPSQKVRCRRCEGFDCNVTRIPRGTLFLPGWVRSGSSDEEMTFMTCNGCGQQWYHSSWVCL